ncbi:MAG: hypothetical protein ACK6CE_01985, partial [Planctomycetota bacterium]
FGSLGGLGGLRFLVKSEVGFGDWRRAMAAPTQAGEVHGAAGFRTATAMPAMPAMPAVPAVPPRTGDCIRHAANSPLQRSSSSSSSLLQ